MPDKVLITGGAGFAGFHISEHLLHSTDWDVIVLDRLSTPAGSLERLRETKAEFGDRLQYVYHDFRAAFNAYVINRLEGVRYILHNGAETHVERSLHDPESFVLANVVGTMHVLEAARKLQPEALLYVSTDEVHGPAPDGVDFKEDAPIKPSNPYSAAKAGGEALAYSYWKSFQVPVITSRTMNLCGEKQHVEKFVPMVMRKVLHGERVIVHGSAERIGSRKWLHARNQADALLFLLRGRGANPPWQWGDTPVPGNGTSRPIQNLLGETFHVAGVEKTNLEIAQLIAKFMGKPLDYELVNFHASRPGHDSRYSLSDEKIRRLGWVPPVEFEESLRRTVEWTLRPENQCWLADEAAPAAALAAGRCV